MTLRVTFSLDRAYSGSGLIFGRRAGARKSPGASRGQVDLRHCAGGANLPARRDSTLRRRRRRGAPRYRACGRWASLSPNSHSSKATRLTIRASQSLASTRRHEPHCQHRSSRGRLCALTTPTWPHVHAILSIIGAFALGRKSPRQSFLRGLKFGVGEREPRAAR
jgi:hypothetical protein